MRLVQDFCLLGVQFTRLKIQAARIDSSGMLYSYVNVYPDHIRSTKILVLILGNQKYLEY